MGKPRVLVVCTGNSMRSQIAEGILRAQLGSRIEVFSAGTHPSLVYPLAVRVLEDVGIDTSLHRSKSINEFLNAEIDLVITLCDNARAVCPDLPNARKVIHKAYPDPLHQIGNGDLLGVFADLRDQMTMELVPLVVKELELGSSIRNA